MSKTDMVAVEALKAQHAEEKENLSRQLESRIMFLQQELMVATHKSSWCEAVIKTNAQLAVSNMYDVMGKHRFEMDQLKRTFFNKISHLERQLKQCHKKLRKYEACKPGYQSILDDFRQSMQAIHLHIDFPDVERGIAFKEAVDEELAQLNTKLDEIFSSFDDGIGRECQEIPLPEGEDDDVVILPAPIQHPVQVVDLCDDGQDDDISENKGETHNDGNPKVDGVRVGTEKLPSTTAQLPALQLSPLTPDYAATLLDRDDSQN
ncbi:unnamed protein product [Orchesella dallaii]|uniref:Uncharacterized protein n=1 Tax=Orchesella dallaii TaxID=48710 RepID=A0ABP1RIY3_9HEXA